MNPMTAVDFSELAADFCSRHSFDQPPTAPTLHGTGRPGKRPVQEMTEEEQLEAALRASRNEVEDEDMAVRSKQSIEDEEHSVAPALSIYDTKESSSIVQSAVSTWETELAAMNVGDEPTVNDGVARIMFRMPDGKRLVRKFYLADSVKKVYGYVAVRLLFLPLLFFFKSCII